MDYRPLARTGVKVSKWCLGTMTFGAAGGTDADIVDRLVGQSIEHGINFIDTADAYGGGESESLLGAALAGRRNQIVLATKFHMPTGPGINDGGNSRRHIMLAVEASLRRLETDWIDLYQVHRPDPSCAIEETLGALTDLVRQGKVRFVGTSAFPAEQLVEAQWVAERDGLARPVSEQPPYSLFTRAIEAAVLPTCARHSLAVLAWSPLNGGWLTGKYRDGSLPEGSRAAKRSVTVRFFAPGAESDRKATLVEEIAGVADDLGCSLTQLALAWVDAHPAITSTIIGPRTEEQLEDLWGATDLRLGDDVLDRLDAIAVPGRDINPADVGYLEPSLFFSNLRRRPT